MIERNTMAIEVEEGRREEWVVGEER